MNPWLALPLSVAALVFPIAVGFAVRAVTRRKKVDSVLRYVMTLGVAGVPAGVMKVCASHYGATSKQSLECAIIFWMLGVILFSAVITNDRKKRA